MGRVGLVEGAAVGTGEGNSEGRAVGAGEGCAVGSPDSTAPWADKEANAPPLACRRVVILFALAVISFLALTMLSVATVAETLSTSDGALDCRARLPLRKTLTVIKLGGTARMMPMEMAYVALPPSSFHLLSVMPTTVSVKEMVEVGPAGGVAGVWNTPGDRPGAQTTPLVEVAGVTSLNPPDRSLLTGHVVSWGVVPWQLLFAVRKNLRGHVTGRAVLGARVRTAMSAAEGKPV